jgi:hypothetical protein
LSLQAARHKAAEARQLLYNGVDLAALKINGSLRRSEECVDELIATRGYARSSAKKTAC